MLETILWVFLGIIVGASTGMVALGLVSAGRFEDLENEIRDLRSLRQLLKEEIFRLDTKLNDKKTYN